MGLKAHILFKEIGRVAGVCARTRTGHVYLHVGATTRNLVGEVKYLKLFSKPGDMSYNPYNCILPVGINRTKN